MPCNISDLSLFCFLLAWVQAIAQAVPVLFSSRSPPKFFSMFTDDRFCLRNLSVMVFEMSCFFGFIKQWFSIVTPIPSGL